MRLIFMPDRRRLGLRRSGMRAGSGGEAMREPAAHAGSTKGNPRRIRHRKVTLGDPDRGGVGDGSGRAPIPATGAFVLFP
ncbi:hypothetical protein GXW74_13080 [Roseomonas eburnea]|uniref:Uncharacterized protein n=1 Tax=Neoroseomonas eburnea TaxID=1346889 RepID=A0A9X9XCI6_9PROT|nr:hypothetical protein [Neoroseomonas eburnea]MBR0681422.1 hypothetical protein [Neoroseomonas eburnea]